MSGQRLHREFSLAAWAPQAAQADLAAPWETQTTRLTRVIENKIHIKIIKIL